MNAKKITCRKCRGTGNVGGVVVCAGIPGGCFSCLATGKVYVDKFDRVFADEKGEFFGVTSVRLTGRGLVTTKSITKCAPFKCGTGVTAKPITEEQARKFFAKYSTSIEVSCVVLDAEARMAHIRAQR